jgi:hypothetical protein
MVTLAEAERMENRVTAGSPLVTTAPLEALVQLLPNTVALRMVEAEALESL